MRKFKWLPGYTGVIRVDDGKFIALTSPDWSEVAEWMTAGNEPSPVAPPNPARAIPKKLLRYVLIDRGLDAAWDAALAASRAYVRAYWAEEPNPPQNNPKMIALCKAVGIDIELLYDLAARR